MRRRFHALWLSIALLPAHAHAQTEPATSNDMIIVEAPPQETSQQARRLSRRITRQTNLRTLTVARFSMPVCPGVMGLPVELAEIIIDRIRANAERIGLPTVAQDNCQPDILIAFVQDGHAALESLIDNGSSQLLGTSPYARRQTLNQEGPVWALNLTYSVPREPLVATRMYLNYSQAMVRSLVIIERDAIVGMTTTQLADYASMRTFVRTRAVSAGSSPRTILSLFDPEGAAPEELTSFDITYLQTTYAAPDGELGATTVSRAASAYNQGE